METILEVKNLRVSFTTQQQKIYAVNGVDFSVARGEILGIVGESGCGKSVTALSILGLVPSPPGSIDSGQVLYAGKNLLNLTPKQWRSIRGEKISMIFQDPLSSLNPVLTIGQQMGEILKYQKGLNFKERLSSIYELLVKTKITQPELRVKQYPHELSGGQRQRVMIGMSLSCNPDILIADEPTTALDVTVQANVLRLMKTLCRENGTALILITHDMGVIAKMCHRVVVKYAGYVVETANTKDLFNNPAHPYTVGLLLSLPRFDQQKRRLFSIEGQPPSLKKLPVGCPFAERCHKAKEICRCQVPELENHNEKHTVRCFFPEGKD